MYFDYFMYRPGPDVEMSGKTVLLDDLCPLVVYESGGAGGQWEVMENGSVHQTQEQGAKMNVVFAGTSISLSHENKK